MVIITKTHQIPAWRCKYGPLPWSRWGCGVGSPHGRGSGCIYRINCNREEDHGSRSEKQPEEGAWHTMDLKANGRVSILFFRYYWNSGVNRRTSYSNLRIWNKVSPQNGTPQVSEFIITGNASLLPLAAAWAVVGTLSNSGEGVQR